MPPASAAPAAPTLPDAWDARPVPLDGRVERDAYPPLLMLFGVLLGALVLFQLVISPIALVGLLLLEGVAPADLLARLTEALTEHVGALLGANTISQFLGLALPAWLVLYLHTSRPAAFIRLRRVDGLLLAASVLGWFAITPLVQWLGSINQLLPLPDALEALEESQMEMIRSLIESDFSLILGLFVLAVTPALCEELLFRGYVQRQAERAMGIWGGILFTGVVFGLYHLRLTQVLPLALLGVYLAYLTWRTGSLWPAIAVHFLNNGAALAFAEYAEQRPEMNLDALETITVPVWAALLSLVATVGVVVWIHQRAQQLLEGTRAAHAP